MAIHLLEEYIEASAKEIDLQHLVRETYRLFSFRSGEFSA